MNASLPLFSYRSVFISDLHLGTRGARTDFLLDFLRSMTCDHLYLVGDIVDGWRLRRSWYWDSAHDDVLRLLLKRAREGTQVTYIPGNHDEALRAWLPLAGEVAGVRIARDAEHTTAAGLRLLVMHGDEFDSVVRYAKVMAHLGDHAYTTALALNQVFNFVRRHLGYPYWSLSQWLKGRVKGAVAAIDGFEQALAAHARAGGFDGVVCGHIHCPAMREIGGVLYLNDGDWVESCTALVEHKDGVLELVDWPARRNLSFAQRRRPAAAPAAALVPTA